MATAHFANDAVTGMLPALLPSLSSRFDLSAPDVALLVSVFAISTSLPQPLFGFLADKNGGQRVAAAGLAVSALLLAGLGWVSSAPALAAALLFGGLGSSALHPAGMGLARAAAQRNPGLALALFSSAGMAGGAFGPVLALGVAAAWGLEALAWAAVPALVVAAWLGRGTARPAPSLGRASPVSLARGLFDGPLGWLTVVALLANLVMLTFTSAMPVWLVAERGLSETSPVLGATLATFSFAAAMGGIAGGWLARRVRVDLLIAGSLALSVVALEAVLLTAPGSMAYFAAAAASGALLGVQGPLLIARAQELRPGAESVVAGVLLGATSGAAGLLYAGVGALQASFGIGNTLAAVALLALPAAHLARVTLRPATVKHEADCGEECARAAVCCAPVAVPS